MKTPILSSLILSGIIASGIYLSVNNANKSQYAERSSSSNISLEEEGENALGMLDMLHQIRANQVTGEVSAVDVLNVRNDIASRKSYKSSFISWESMGPNNEGGRTRAILVDKDDPNKIWAGGVTGGLFYSTNGGGNWLQAKGFTNFMVSTIAQTTSGDILVGTGCIFDQASYEGTGGNPGGGIYKSTDGINFTAIPSTVPTTSNSQSAEWAGIQRIKTDPNNSNTIYAGTNRGLRVSTNGGTSWINPIKANCQFEITGAVHDIEIAADGSYILIGMAGGSWRSTTPTTECSYEQITGVNSYQRIDVSISPADKNVVYALTVVSGLLGDIYKSTNGGKTFTNFTPAFPRSTSGALLFGDNGQGFYDMCIEASPKNTQTFFIGGVQLWRFDGNWTRMANEFAPEFSGAYVHSDKHYIYVDPHNSSRVYVCSDGGLGKSDDNGNTWYTVNRDYNTTQFYAVACTPDGRVIGGTQDNGTFYLSPFNSVPGDASSILGGDGFDCEVSQIVPEAAIATLYYGAIHRTSGGGGFADVSGQYDGQAPFHTTVKIWESLNDPTSKDTITFSNAFTEKAIGVGDGVKKTYKDTLRANQTSAQIIQGSVFFKTQTGASADDFDGDGVITGDATGTVDYSNNYFDITWTSAPNTNSQVIAGFDTRYNAGSVLQLSSNTGSLPVSYTLTSAIEVDDVLKIQDPVQTMTVMGLNTSGGVIMCRNMWDFGSDPAWFKINGSSPVGTARCFEFSKDGNHLFIGSENGAVYRISGLNNVYKLADVAANVTVTQVFSGSQFITGIAISEDNPEVLVVTQGNFGNNSYVWLLDNAVSSTGAASKKDVTGDLPKMPVYDAEIDVQNPSLVVIGTEMGIWATTNIFSPAVTWTSQNAELQNVPVHDVRQQKLNWDRASNAYQLYAATFGRGIWNSTSLVSTPEIEHYMFNDSKITSAKIFPNPASTYGNIEFELNADAMVEISIYDLSGKLVKLIPVKHYTAGKSQIQLNVSAFKQGNYVASVKVGSEIKVAKFMVIR